MFQLFTTTKVCQWSIETPAERLKQKTEKSVKEYRDNA